jgi:hypothetical protein
MLALIAPAYGAPQSRVEFFPSELHVPSIECPWGNTRQEYSKNKVKLALLSDFEGVWFSAQLRAANEPSLFEQSLKQPEGIARSYRFTWLRSFHAPVFVRIDEQSDGVMKLTAKRLTGQGGLAPGRLSSTMRRQLTASEKEDVRRMFASGDFATYRVNRCDMGTDGAVWLLETRLGGKYQVVNQFSPQSGPIRQIGLALLLLTGWKNEPVY